MDVSHEGAKITKEEEGHGGDAPRNGCFRYGKTLHKCVHDSVMPDMAKSFRAAPALAAEKITPDSKSVQPRDFPTTPGKRFPPTCLCPPGGIKRPALA
jgi:hypothetical protein